MAENEMILAATAFIKADMEYLRLLERAVDNRGKAVDGITDLEMRELKLAKAEKDTLEEQMYCILTQYHIEP